jgi:hypothetical protein
MNLFLLYLLKANSLLLICFAFYWLFLRRNMHYFGIIRESDGKVSTVFTFVNKGDKPLLINNVKASCGCTTPEWTKEPVAPGQRGYIRATYDPAGRIYVFERTLTVYSNGFPAQVMLRIRGEAVMN